MAIFWIFPYIGNLIIPIDSYFSEGWPNHQPDSVSCYLGKQELELARVMIPQGITQNVSTFTVEYIPRKKKTSIFTSMVPKKSPMEHLWRSSRLDDFLRMFQYFPCNKGGFGYHGQPPEHPTGLPAPAASPWGSSCWNLSCDPGWRVFRDRQKFITPNMLRINRWGWLFSSFLFIFVYFHDDYLSPQVSETVLTTFLDPFSTIKMDPNGLMTLLCIFQGLVV